MKQLILSILILVFLPIFSYAQNYIAEDDLGYCLVAYFEDQDLNNDGTLENVEVIEPCRVFTNLPDGLWGDDTGATITIADSNGRQIFWDEVGRYQPVENVSLVDLNYDGTLEVVISLGKTEEYEATDYTYGWEDDKYQLLHKEQETPIVSAENLRRQETFADYTVRIYRDYESGAGLFQILRDSVIVYSRSGSAFDIGHVWVDFPKEDWTRIGSDITGDGEPNLVISQFTGGAHCCFIFYVFSIGYEFKVLDIINAADTLGSYFEDLDGDGIFEFLSRDWSYAYWNACFAESPFPNIVLEFRDGKYQLAPELMIKPAPSFEKEAEVIREIQADERWGWDFEDAWTLAWSNGEGFAVPPQVWEHMLDLIYTGHTDLAWYFLDKVWFKDEASKQAFQKDFKEKLKSSNHWDLLKVNLGK